jgi:hypothetical protein
MTDDEICALSDSEYKRNVMMKLHPDKNLGCTETASAKTAKYNGIRSSCQKSPGKRNVTSRQSARSPKKSPKNANELYTKFRKRNNVTLYNDVIRELNQGSLGTLSNVAGDTVHVLKGLTSAVVGTGRAVVDTVKGAFHLAKGVGNVFQGIGRQGAQGYRYGQKTFSRMMYKNIQNRLKNCKDCSPLELQKLQDDVDERFTAIKAVERQKRDYLLSEAKAYAENVLLPHEAKPFYELATERIEQDYNKALHSLQTGGTRRSR